MYGWPVAPAHRAHEHPSCDSDAATRPSLLGCIRQSTRGPRRQYTAAKLTRQKSGGVARRKHQDAAQVLASGMRRGASVPNRRGSYARNGYIAGRSVTAKTHPKRVRGRQAGSTGVDASCAAQRPMGDACAGHTGASRRHAGGIGRAPARGRALGPRACVRFGTRPPARYRSHRPRGWGKRALIPAYVMLRSPARSTALCAWLGDSEHWQRICNGGWI